MKLVSVLVPIYNEKNTVISIFEAIHAAPFPKGLDYEIVAVDDASTDGTTDILKNFSHPRVKVFFKDVNAGKGAALATAISQATGDILIIQDADLEYDPQEYPTIFGPILSGKADVVYGSRFLGSPSGHRVLFFWHSIGNQVLTLISNMFTNLNLTDMETCYKAFTRKAIEGISIESKRFGVEPELTAKFSRKKCRIYEVPISYNGRDYNEGKKITWKDGVSALNAIIKFNLFPKK